MKLYVTGSKRAQFLQKCEGLLCLEHDFAAEKSDPVIKMKLVYREGT